MSKLDDVSEPLMTVREVAAAMNASEKTVRRRIAAGKLSVIRDGRLIRIRPKDYRSYLESKLKIMTSHVHSWPSES
jgi:excisionase family DNA binding protein